MVHLIKLPDSSKTGLLSCLLQLCILIMQDIKVFILLFLLGKKHQIKLMLDQTKQTTQGGKYTGSCFEVLGFSARFR